MADDQSSAARLTAEEDQDALRAAARDLGCASFETAEQADQEGLKALREAGVESSS